MGYTTDFYGSLKIDKILDDRTVLDIKRLNEYDPNDSIQKTSEKPNSVCKWTVGEGNQDLLWNEQEKFYYYIEWLKYIIEKILKPGGYKLSGYLIFQGEDIDLDTGKIIVIDNTIKREIFNAQEIERFHESLELEAQKKAGEILLHGLAKKRSLYRWIFLPLFMILRRGIFNTGFSYTIALVREKDGTVNFYNIMLDELDKNLQITSRLLISMRGRMPCIPLSKITEIIYYDSILYRWFLRSNHPYCIVNRYGDSVMKTLYSFKDERVICAIKESMQVENLTYRYVRGNNWHLLYFLGSRFLGGLVIVYLTFWSVIFVIFSIIGFFKNDFSWIHAIFVVMIASFYYFIVVKIFFKLFYYVFPIELFRTKTASNSVVIGK